MASASRATARMSSAAALFAMRYSGSSRASAFFAGSSDGKTLSVMAIRGLGMARSQCKHLRIDAVRQLMAPEQRQYIVDDDVRHRFAHLRRGAAEMRCQHDIRHPAQRLVDLGLMLEHVKAGAGDLLFRKRAHQRRLVDDRAARG